MSDSTKSEYKNVVDHLLTFGQSATDSLFTGFPAGPLRDTVHELFTKALMLAQFEAVVSGERIVGDRVGYLVNTLITALEDAPTNVYTGVESSLKNVVAVHG